MTTPTEDRQDPAHGQVPVLTAAVAQGVVDQVMGRLGHNVNIMDGLGRIVGSGDAGRIGDVHEGARLVLAQGAPVSVTAQEAERMTGTLAGVNCPIVLDGRLIGVVGVSGDPRQVFAAASSVALTVELLLAQEQTQDERAWRARARTQIIEDLAEGLLAEDDWDRRCQRVGARLTPPCTVTATVLSVPLTALESRRLLDAAGPQVLIALDVADVLWVIAGRGGQAAARRAQEAVRASLPRGGLDGPVVDAGQAPDVRCLADLVRRTRLATRGSVTDDVTLQDLELPVLLAELDDGVRAGACQRLLAGLSPDLKHTIRALLAADLVVSRAAVALNVHRNTLLGRLDRIARITGRDPRLFQDAAALHAGLLLEQPALRTTR